MAAYLSSPKNLLIAVVIIAALAGAGYLFSLKNKADQAMKQEFVAEFEKMVAAAKTTEITAGTKSFAQFYNTLSSKEKECVKNGYAVEFESLIADPGYVPLAEGVLQQCIK